ncbi:succinate dehydrogenase subunit C [Geothermobacter ehrlichii]|uniref:Succinate dehydrogenase subunit C n=1 Tax=Geothermobacter ehrlichii TaxID=213224 RepID=A0A5D3WQD7_9BACT|nr:succinate dehydrogenase cytochrome b subunit [Geothermobacter ehrlichii]TYP00020.1 succinate dehydrogenase subunit C [Geothermobacter ehrlichii]
MSMLKSSVGRKVIMAVTGLILILFITGHVLGNMSLYAGPDGINAYAVHLRDLGPLLWVVRLVMLVVFVAHIWLGISLTLENRSARPVSYTQKVNQKTSFAAETMIVSGLVILVFVVYHLLNFTLHAVGVPAGTGELMDAAGRFDVYTMVVTSFKQVKLNVLLYVVGMVALFLHVSHGFQSWIQTLGWNNTRTLPAFTKVSKLYAFVVALAYISIPILALAILKA